MREQQHTPGCTCTDQVQCAKCEGTDLSPLMREEMSISMEDVHEDEPTESQVAIQVMRRALRKIAAEDHPDGYFARIAKAALEMAE